LNRKQLKRTPRLQGFVKANSDTLAEEKDVNSGGVS
jgi:hypothetical protein